MQLMASLAKDNFRKMQPQMHTDNRTGKNTFVTRTEFMLNSSS
ncbi:hypothetical protein NIES4074_58450 [Cylindrospermum sp. NIES-4074]|nr:hypothetical protein NIES4074_58450 [Cylindrospermum sp. NIES-4074]